MISLLLSIPLDVIRSRICPFLNILSMCKLDSATLTKEHRTGLLSGFLNGTIVVEKDVTYDKDSTEWLIRRCIGLQNILFPPQSEPADLEYAAPTLSRAVNIDLTGCTKFTNESVQLVLQSCKRNKLKSISFTGCTWLNDQTLQVLADCHAESLKEFLVSECPLITDAGVATSLSRSCGIVEVMLDGCGQVGPLTLAALADRLLATLSIASCPAITDQALVGFLNKCSCEQLTFIDISRNSELTGDSLMAIALHCPALLFLHINHCEAVTDAGRVAVIESCQQLIVLRADMCVLSLNVLNKLSSSLSPRLTVLTMECPDLNEQHVDALTQRCPLLSHLHICDAEGFTDRAMGYIGKRLSKLKILTVDSCPNFTFKGILSIVCGCIRLEALHFFSCPGMCDRALSAIALHCSGLLQLSVVVNEQITDAGVCVLAEHCSQLQCLGLGETLIADAAVQYLIERCPELIGIDLYDREELELPLVDLVRQRGIQVRLLEGILRDEVD